MPIALPDIHNPARTSEQRPFPMVTFYGQAGVGKTTIAAEFPRPYLINVEGGVPEGIDIPYSGRVPVRDYDYLVALLESFQYQEHNYKTLIIDSLDTLEKKVIHPYVKRKNDFDSIDQTFGRAYTRSSETMDKILERLEDLRIRKKMYIVLTAAAVKESFDDLVNNSYHRFNLGLQSQVSSRIFHQSDFLFFMKPDVYMVKEKGQKKERPAGSSRRILCTSIMPMWVAKSRARGLPNELEYELGNGFNMLKPYLIGFITGKSKLQQVQAPLQVAEGQTVAEAKAEAAKQEDAIAGVPEQQEGAREDKLAEALLNKMSKVQGVTKEKALEVAKQLIAASETRKAVKVTAEVNPDDDGANNAAVEDQQELSETLDDDIPF